MSEIDDFLKGKAEAEPAPEAEAPPAPEQETAPPPAEAPSEGEDAEADLAAKEGEPLIPRRAYEDERRKRQDHKERAAKLEGELAEVRRQMEELRKAPPTPPQQYQPPQPVDPAQDPQGFVSRVQEVVLNERLNTSELLARQAHGAETVDAAIAEFKEAAKADPSLFPKLYGNPHPYDWMLKQVEKLRVQREMGDDPAAYRTKMEAEIRERVMAEMAQQQPQAPRVSPAAGLAPSLANVRSAAPRSAPAFSGPPSLNDVLGR
jgi:hypothetical protein